jgi:5-methyltetrahydrofolate--homocysteine methyltransferase
MKPINPLRKRAKPEKQIYARTMRANPTPSEEILWERLRAKRLGVKFRRQAIILGWIADFYCPSERLVIELDGVDHQRPARKVKDEARDQAMQTLGLHILRIKSARVHNDLEAVMTEIRAALKQAEH